MRERPYKYIPGDPWLICDECGLKYRRSEMLKRWDGFMVCKKDYEHRHPQEFVRATTDKISFADSRPDYDPQIGSNLLGTPDYIDSDITDNGDGTFTLDGSQTGDVFIVWYDVVSSGYTYRANILVSEHESGRARLYSPSVSIIKEGEFSSDTVWISTAGISIDGGVLSHLVGFEATTRQPAIIDNNSKFVVRADILDRTAGNVTFNLFGTDAYGTTSGLTETSTSVVDIDQAGGGYDDMFSITMSSDFDGSVDNVYACELNSNETDGLSTGYLSNNGNYSSEEEYAGLGYFVAFTADENFVGTIKPELHLVTSTTTTSGDL